MTNQNEEIKEPIIEHIYELQPSWLSWYRFPIVPIFLFRMGNENNLPAYAIHWLIFRGTTTDLPDIGFEVRLDDQQLHIKLRLPYLVTGLFIPLFPKIFHQKMWLKPVKK